MINYLLFITTAFLLFLAFRVLRFVSYRVSLVRKYYPLIIGLELGLWITFLFWLINHFFKSKPYYNNLVLVLVLTAVILLVWFYIKDVVAGFLFRIKHNPMVGQLIESPEGVGAIKKLSASQIMVEEEGRKIIRIPYSKILNKSISIASDDIHAASEVVIRLGTDSGTDLNDMERRIRLVLLQSPWCVPHKPIRIEFPSNENGGIEIAFHLVDKSFAETAKLKICGLLNK